jgi:transposase-like protein
MDDTACRAFFAQPSNPHQRRYEALRAVFVEGRTAKEVAEQFGMAYSSLRQWLYEFRQHCQQPAAESPFFKSPKSDAPLEPHRRPIRPRESSPSSPIARSSSCRRPSRCG